MNQILHIFRKDVHRLWPLISILFILIAIHAVLDVLNLPFTVLEDSRTLLLSRISKVLLPICMWLLIAVAVFQEALSDDREFWLTRPYHRWKLLAAKTLFFLIFINLPLFISDCYILGIQGFPVLSSLPDLFLRQVQVTVLFVLPQFLIAMVTSGVGQFVLAWIVLILAIVLQLTAVTLVVKQNTSVSMHAISFPPVVLAIVFFAVLRWQYFKRETTKSRVAILSCALFAFPITLFFPSFKEATPPEGKSDIRVEYNLKVGRSPMSDQAVPSLTQVVIRIPVKVEGLPPKTLFRGYGTLSIDANGKSWPERGEKVSATLSREYGVYWQEFRVPISTIDTLKGPVSIHSVLNLEVLTNEVKFTTSVDEPLVVAPGVGRCFSSRFESSIHLACRAGLGNIGEIEIAATSKRNLSQRNGYIPGGRLLPWGLSPVSDVCHAAFDSIPSGSKFEFIPHDPIVKFSRRLDLPNVQLTDFVVNP